MIESVKINYTDIMKMSLEGCIKQWYNACKPESNMISLHMVSLFLKHYDYILFTVSGKPATVFSIIIDNNGNIINKQWYQYMFEDNELINVLTEILDKRIKFINKLSYHVCNRTAFYREWSVHSSFIGQICLNNVLNVNDILSVLVGNLPEFILLGNYIDILENKDWFITLNRSFDEYFNFMETYPNNHLAKIIQINGIGR